MKQILKFCGCSLAAFVVLLVSGLMGVLSSVTVSVFTPNSDDAYFAGVAFTATLAVLVVAKLALRSVTDGFNQIEGWIPVPILVYALCHGEQFHVMILLAVFVASFIITWRILSIRKSKGEAHKTQVWDR